ncbi:energy transducer TonB [Winogradskyella arenosi]|uniref:Outer membrane transport energization protein TonB n=1 Tax=Winogradskyella arenosi TaxID=533325 RepID=A0A368ZHM6_9FLAO|nr:energy transducer TonB [Winogradskyella arenosi]RCW92359.1 outer membrane transport energization protein TonB [Winogradskyella arenosi]
MQIKKNIKANVGRNSSLYFAVGLNVMLALTYLGLEHKTYNKTTTKVETLMVEAQIEEDIPITRIEISPPPPSPPPQQTISEVITLVEDTAEVEETFIESTEIGQDDVIGDPAVVRVEEVEVIEVEEEVEVPFAVIEKVPQFPGCTGTNEALKACFQSKMQAHILKNFRYPEIASELNMQGRVFVTYLIDEQGEVTKIKSRGPDPILEEEAERIIKLLPKMIPGKQRNVPVRVPYSIPITFKLQG